MPVDQVLKESEEKMAKSEAAMMHEFEGVRTGKANPALVENLMVDAYGSSMRMRDMAGITAPETRMILIQPWDVSTVDAIAKAIQAANLGLNPAVDGKVIRIPLPDLSQERREELVKVAKKITEDGRVAVRHIRRDAMDAKGKDAWKPAAPRTRVVTQALRAYAALTTSAARGAVRDVSQVE